MTEQIGLWRAAYNPGDWVVLGGPTSLVILHPAPADRSDLVEELWEIVVEADSFDDLMAGLTNQNVSQMPDFGVFFWHDGAMRSLIHGDLTVTDLDTNEEIANGGDAVTWTEIGLGDVRRVRVDVPHNAGDDRDGLRLPLIVGVVTASAVELDARPAALVRSPQPVPFDAAGPRHSEVEPVAELEPARSAVVDVEVVEEEAPPRAEVAAESPPADLEAEAAQVVFDPEPPVVPERRLPFNPFRRSTPPAPPPAPPAAPPAPPVPPAPPAPPTPPVEVPVTAAPPAPAAAPNPFAFQDSFGPGDRSAPPGPPPMVQVPSPPEPPREGQVLGVLCARNHPNPPDAQQCRRCGGPLQGQPQMMPQPIMAMLRPSNADPVVVDRSVLIGRSPQASKVSGDEIPRLLTVVSPSTDISRTHLQVSPQGWEVTATDLNSTNGTLLIRPGQPEPERLPAGEPVLVFPGCVLDLGDGVSILVDHPE